ncbi:hypothetical protein MC7420_584 [Coleofasciculus chthonoplastes PCC 7420]|uniref:Uncharacterized protein n=1 Tax=Coleofasciculus chthonoplastes PCC 7420 TaxID=118168 RepID=B4VKU0_9CYAN|nr:hypothetical protein MC7420_584 [Coleofasciculus chthonoplastes PCC 7420]
MCRIIVQDFEPKFATTDTEKLVKLIRYRRMLPVSISTIEKLD